MELPDRRIAAELLEDALSMERAFEGSPTRMLYAVLPEEGFDELRDLIFEMRVRSGSHFYRLLEIADDLDLDVNPEDVEVGAYGDTLIREGSTLLEVLQRLRRHERNAEGLYRRFAESLENSSFEGLEAETRSAAKELRILADEEGDHAEKFDDLIENLEKDRARSIRL